MTVFHQATVHCRWGVGAVHGALDINENCTGNHGKAIIAIRHATAPGSW